MARLGNYLLGIEGLALIRRWLVHDSRAAAERVEEMRRLLATFDQGLASIDIPVPVVGVGEGYRDWSDTYDASPNPLILAEEPAVRSLLDATRPGDALDAACGTGRHAAYLQARGHRVVGVDASPEMLAKARARSPGIDWRIGDLTALPVERESIDLVVCALALAHVPDLGPAIAELARVTRPGGRVIISEFHPVNVVLGGEALFARADGSYAFVRSHPHDLGSYVAAAVAADLEVRSCAEPVWTEEHVRILAGPMFSSAPDAFREALVGVPAAVVWELIRN